MRSTQPLFGLVVIAALVGGGSTAAPPRSPPTAGQHLRLAPIERALPGPGQVAVGRFLSNRTMARGPRAGGIVGDYFVRTQELLAVIGALDGVLRDVAPGPQFVDGIGWGAVQVCHGKTRYAPQLRSVALLDGSRRSVEVRGFVPPLGLELRTRYHTPPGQHRLEMETELQNVGPRALDDVAVCEELGLGNTRLQVPGVGEVRRPQTVSALFAARREAGVSYMLMRRDGKALRLPLEMVPPLLAFDPTLVVEHERGRLLPGERRQVERQLIVRPGPLHEALEEALSASSLRTLRATVQLDQDPVLEGAPPTLLDVQRDGKPFLRTQASRRLELMLPRDGGRYSVALLVPGAGKGRAVPLSPRSVARPRLPARSSLLVGVVDPAGKPLPARLLLRGEKGTPDPAFGSDEGLRLENVVYLDEPREKLLLAPGAYRVVASRGPHYSLAEAHLQLAVGDTRRLTFKLKKVVRTDGWLGADLHLHTTSSFDSPVRPAERIASGAALGVDLLVLTDHNAITAAALAPPKIAAGQPMVISGEEVTSSSPSIGHFNVFPLRAGGELPARQISPTGLFAGARARTPLPLIQVNHPRMEGIGYFDQMQLDPASGRAGPAYDPGFDLLEVLNGDQLDQPEAITRVLGDWYQLLNRGQRYVATGGSDGHRLAVQEPGTPRTLILWDPTGKRSEPTEAVVLAALRAGRAVASSGPFVRFSIDGQPAGSLLRGGRRLLLRLQVEAPAWMSVSTATLVANGSPLLTFRARGGEPVRLQVEHRLQPKADTWYAVVVRGDKPDPTLLRPGMLPFAVTNPIFVDVDGDGRCLPRAAVKR